MDQIGAMWLGMLPAAQAAGTAGGTGAAALSAPQAAVDFSLGTMFAEASPVVQAVMLLLIAASFWSWAIIVEKAIAYRRLSRSTRRFETLFWSGRPLDEIYDDLGPKPGSPIERVFAAGMAEWRRSFAGEAILPGTQARVERAMSVALVREGARMTRRLPFLATVGSVAPFVGLFATVWGIKNSFESIAGQQNTNLAVVAPGIAEALLATALGLLAAIPAVVAYNRLVSDAEGMAEEIENFSDEFSTLLAREMDRATAETV